MAEKSTTLQKVGWVFAAGFLFTVILGYIPGVNDADGLMFGLFKIDLIDDVLHLVSAAWAAFAAWHSLGFTIFYFRWFGLTYLLDGIIGVITGKGLLDFTVFMQGSGIAEMGTRIAVNVPHIVIGSTAVIIGFFLSRKYIMQS